MIKMIVAAVTAGAAVAAGAAGPVKIGQINGPCFQTNGTSPAPAGADEIHAVAADGKPVTVYVLTNGAFIVVVEFAPGVACVPLSGGEWGRP